MEKDLTRNGMVGLELTREEVADLMGALVGLERKAQCRAVNQDVIDYITKAKTSLMEADDELTDIIGD